MAVEKNSQLNVCTKPQVINMEWFVLCLEKLQKWNTKSNDTHLPLDGFPLTVPRCSMTVQRENCKIFCSKLLTV